MWFSELWLLVVLGTFWYHTVFGCARSCNRSGTMKRRSFIAGVLGALCFPVSRLLPKKIGCDCALGNPQTVEVVTERVNCSRVLAGAWRGDSGGWHKVWWCSVKCHPVSSLNFSSEPLRTE